ncbi:MAG: cobalamin-dependent protein [Chloroflexota bacterium]
MSEQKTKVVTAKVGLDDHYRGIISVTEALREAGMEVVYLGTGQRVDGVVSTIMQEDADVVGLSFLCGGHLQVMKRLLERMKEKGLEDVAVVVGGVIPDEDISRLKEMGISEVFLPGTPMEAIVKCVQRCAASGRVTRKAQRGQHAG